MKTIIFDFNKTLYNPETDALYADAMMTCEMLRSRGYRLLLLSQQKSERSELITKMGLSTVFERVVLTTIKDISSFERLLDGLEVVSVTVVGDGLDREIRIGSELGYRTIFVDRESGEKQPSRYTNAAWRTITELHHILECLP